MKQHLLWLLASLTLLFQLSACSTTAVKTKLTNSPQTSVVISNNTKGWHYARFRIPYPKNSQPNWSMGPLIAVEIIQPVLNKHRKKIQLWRFHRRAVHDGGGHLFSFIFYTDKTTASQIYQEIQANKLLQQLEKEQKLAMLKPEDLSKNPRPNIEDTSDKNWSLIIQKTWPEYIMGVSQQWLNMVTEISKDQEKILQPIARYKKVQDIATKIWIHEGKHAFLHHLNAIYAYQPLLMYY